MNLRKSKNTLKKEKNNTPYKIIKNLFDDAELIEDNEKKTIINYSVAGANLRIEIKKTDLFHTFRIINNFDITKKLEENNLFSDEDKTPLGMLKNINSFNKISAGIKTTIINIDTPLLLSFRIESILPISMIPKDKDFFLSNTSLAIGAPLLFIRLSSREKENKKNEIK